MVIDFSRTKTDQSGENQLPKHLFANPYCPSVCVILGMALHVFGTTFRPNNDDKTLLFVGSSYSIFSRWLEKGLEEIDNLGFRIKDFGSHSFRKGIATYCSGFIGGPSVIAIFLRAGWSLGHVQDRYIKFSDGSDQFCGRIAAGLNFHGGSQFAVLPPHFESSEVLTHDQWMDICPGYNDYPSGFQACLPYFLASLVFHYDWWAAKNAMGKYVNISSKHPILQARVVTSGIISTLKEKVLGNFVSECSISGSFHYRR